MKKFFHAQSIILKRFFTEPFSSRAAALAYTTLLALVPLFSVTVSTVAAFPFFQRFSQLSENYLLANLIPSSRPMIQKYVENFIHKASQLPTASLIFLLVTSITLLITIEHSLNDVWQVPRRRKKISSFIFYTIILFVMPIFIGLSLFLSTYVFSLTWFSYDIYTSDIKLGLLTILPLFINTTIFSMLYISAPNCYVNWRYGLLGGLIAAILFELAKKLFTIYITNFENYELIYGALASIPIFLIWLYLSWLIILFGALVTHTFGMEYQKKES